MDRGTYRAIGQTGDTESTSRLNHMVDKGLKEAGTGRTARDRPRDRPREPPGSPRRHATKQIGAQTTLWALESGERSACIGPDKPNWACKVPLQPKSA
jgi:hypothetical protein